MADYFPLLSRTIASLGNSTPEQRQIVYERARGVVADQLSAIEPPMDSDAIRRELSLFEACVMRLEHDMASLEAMKPAELPGASETRKHISARLSDLLAKAAAARAEAKQDMLKRDIEPSVSDPFDDRPAATDAEIKPASSGSPASARFSSSLSSGLAERKKDKAPVDLGSLGDEFFFSKPKDARKDLKEAEPDKSEPEKSEPESLEPEKQPAEFVAPESDDPLPQAEPDVQTGDQSLTDEGLAEPDLPPQVAMPAASMMLEPVSSEQLADVEDADKVALDLPEPISPVLSEPQAEPDPQEAVSQPTVSQQSPISTLDFDAFAKPSIDPPMVDLASLAASRTPWLNRVQTLWEKKSEVAAKTASLLQEIRPQPAPVPVEPEPQALPSLPLALPGLKIPVDPAKPVAGEAQFIGPVQMQEVGSTVAADGTAADPVPTDQAQTEAVVETGQGAEPLPLAPVKPPPQSDIELLDDGRPRLAQRRKRDGSLLRGVIMGVAFVSVIAAVAGTAWVLRDRPADFEPGATVARSDLGRKITDRLPSEGASTASSGAAQGATATASTATGQRVTLFEEGIDGQPDPAPVQGRVTWALETVRDQTGAGDVAIKAEIKDLTGSLSGATMIIKRNRDATFPASHLIELTFATPDKSPSGRVRDIATLEMRAEEGVRGTSLSGLPVPVTENVFLVGLTNLPDRIEQNRDLLRNRNWIVVPMRFASGRRAVLLLEKGLAGDRVLLDAFQAWK